MLRLNRRKTARKRLSLPVQYGIHELDRKGFTMDISPLGMAIKTNQVFRPGTKIMICIDKDEDLLLARGDVRWARQVPPLLVKYTRCGMGIKFIDLNKRFQQFIQPMYANDDLPFDNGL